MVYQIYLRRTLLVFVRWLFFIYFKVLTYIFDKYLYTYFAVQDFYSIVLNFTISSLTVWRSFIAFATFYSAKKHNFYRRNLVLVVGYCESYLLNLLMVQKGRHLPIF